MLGAGAVGHVGCLRRHPPDALHVHLLVGRLLCALKDGREASRRSVVGRVVGVDVEHARLPLLVGGRSRGALDEDLVRRR